MTSHKPTANAFGLALLAAISSLAFIATPAQAGEFRLNGSSFTSKGIASESFTATIAAGKFLVPGLSLTVECTLGAASGTILLGGVGHASALMSGCKVEGNKLCFPFATKADMENGTNSGEISVSGLGELVLMGGKHYFLVESTKLTPFGILYFTKSTKGCTLPLEEPIYGSTVFYLPTALTSVVTQSVQTIPQAELEMLFPSDVLKYGNQTAWLDDGTSTVGLSGGQKWSAE